MTSRIHMAVVSAAVSAVSLGSACDRAAPAGPVPSPAPAVAPGPIATPALAPIASTDLTRAAALRGELPDGAEVNVLASRCAICHTTQYITQQRLTQGQWEKTLVKMKKWGAPIEDAEVPRLALYLGTHFSPALPDFTPRAAEPPAGALP